MSLIFQTVHQQLSDQVPSGSWQYLAGSTSDNTITLPNNSMARSCVEHDTQNLVQFQNQLCLPINDTDNGSCYVVKRTSNGSWVTIGGQISASSQNSAYQSSTIQALYVHQDQLYVAFYDAFETQAPFTYAQWKILHVAKWNQVDSQWEVLTNLTYGLHNDAIDGSFSGGKTQVEYRPGSFGSEVSFISIEGDLYVVFFEGARSTTGTNWELRSSIIASKLNSSATSFSRIANMNLPVGNRSAFLSLSINHLNELIFFQHQGGSNFGGYTFLFSFNGVDFTLINDLQSLSSLFGGISTPVVYGSLSSENEELFSTINNGAISVRVRKSTDNGLVFNTINVPVTGDPRLPTGFQDNRKGKYLNNSLYTFLANSSGNYDLRLYRFDFSNLVWSELGGGTPILGSWNTVDNDLLQLHFVNNIPYIIFRRFDDVTSPNTYRLVIARTKG